MKNVQIKLDGTVYNDLPLNIKELKEVIELDHTLKTWAQHFNEIKLIYTGDAYTYLKGLKDQYGYNKRVNVEISISGEFGGLGDVLRGFHYLTDLEINHTKRTLELPLIEQYFEGAIKLNQNVEVPLFGVEYSLNGVLINSYTPLSKGVRMFDPSDGTYSAQTLSIDIVNALDFAVRYITDDRVAFRDDYFSTDPFGTDKFFALITGFEIRTLDHTSYPRASFNRLITNLYKAFNLWYYIDYSTYKPTLVLDTYQNILSKTGDINFLNQREIKESFYEDNFYNSVKIGSTINQDAVDPNDDRWLKFYSGYTFHEESYSAKNNTMLDRTLDLVMDMVTDHNVIARLITYSVTDYDKELFLIESDKTGALTADASQSDYALLISSPEKRYNENLLNYSRLTRFDLPIDIGITNPTLANDNFEASFSPDFSDSITFSNLTNTIDPFPYNVEVSDPNNNYNPTTYRYIIPAGGGGTYGFYSSFKVVISNMADPGTGSATFIIRIREWYGGAVLKAVKLKTFTINNNTGPEGQLIYFDHAFVGLPGDYFDVQFVYGSGMFFGTVATEYDLTILGEESIFKTIFVQNQGGLLGPLATIRNYFGAKLEYERNISLLDWKSLKANMVQQINTTKAGGAQAISTISKIERLVISGQAKVELITKQNKIGL